MMYMYVALKEKNFCHVLINILCFHDYIVFITITSLLLQFIIS